MVAAEAAVVEATQGEVEAGRSALRQAEAVGEAEGLSEAGVLVAITVPALVTTPIPGVGITREPVCIHTVGLLRFSS